MEQDKVNILLVDDDQVDVRAITRAFQKQRISNPITVASNGLEALEILRGQGKETIERPYMILLDLNMPKMGGLQFLDEIRQDEDLKDSIVFVLTTSDDERDKFEAYSKNIAGYLLKSRAGEDFLQQAKMIQQFMLAVEFPIQK